MPRHPHHDHPHPKSPLPTRRGFLRLLIPGSLFATRALAQQPSDQAEAFRRRSEDFEARGLAEPFKGLTANGEVTPGLFPIRSTGVSTAPVRQAAERFLSSLTAEQRARTLFAIDAPEWRKWMNQHFYVRQGVSLKEMTGAQRDAAFGLLQAAMSAAAGSSRADIMRPTRRSPLTGDRESRASGSTTTAMARPRRASPGASSSTATTRSPITRSATRWTRRTAGSEPVAATSGSTRADRAAGRAEPRAAMMQGLTAGQRKQAVLEFSKTATTT